MELSLDEAKLHEAEVRADPAAEVGPGSCSVLQPNMFVIQGVPSFNPETVSDDTVDSQKSIDQFFDDQGEKLLF